jgi:hypothetical protein
MPPQVAALHPVDLVAAAAHDEHVLDRRRPVGMQGECPVDGGLER